MEAVLEKIGSFANETHEMLANGSFVEAVSSLVEDAKAKANEEPTLAVGAVLAALMVLTAAVGDEFWVARKRRASAGLVPTSAIRPLATLLFAAWLEYYVVVEWIGLKALLAWYAAIAVVALLVFRYFWREPFEGLTIIVRQPRETGKFADLDFTMDPTDLGVTSVLSMMCWFQMSSIIIPFELMIHVLMGRDEERIDEDGGNVTACEGMMAQELVHGKCQMLYSRSAEQTYDYPPGWRRIYKFLLVKVFPADLQRAFVAYLESSFDPVTRVFALCPSAYDALFYRPRWVFAWHLTEESEHSWDSVQDMLEEGTVVGRIVMWAIGLVLIPLMLVFLPLIETLLYAKRALFRSPKTLVLSLATWLVVFPNMALMIHVCNFFHLILGMRPSDYVYHDTHRAWDKVLFKDEYKKMFRNTHTQLPHEHLKVRESFRNSMQRRGRNSLLRTFTAAARGTPAENEPMLVTDTSSSSENKRAESISRLSSFRASLYEESKKDLLKAGMSFEEIEDAGFSESDPDMLGRVADDGKKDQ